METNKKSRKKSRKKSKKKSRKKSRKRKMQMIENSREQFNNKTMEKMRRAVSIVVRVNVYCVFQAPLCMLPWSSLRRPSRKLATSLKLGVRYERKGNWQPNVIILWLKMVLL